MDWLSILTLPNNYEIVWLLVDGKTVRGMYFEYPGATHWAQDEVVY